MFNGPSSVKNIISRVTGGEISWIDGKLGSSISGADMYFLNPAGLIFGPDAALDLTGSFHASTADYLKLGENDRFYAQALKSEVLSIAAPSAFGFLDNDISPITLEGREKITEQEWNGLFTCPECFEPKHPQLDPPYHPADPIALQDPRPARQEPVTVYVGAPGDSLFESDGMQPVTPTKKLIITTKVGNVTVSIS